MMPHEISFSNLGNPGLSITDSSNESQLPKNCDTIVAQAENPIFRKLQFYVIISSEIDPKMKNLLLEFT